MQKLAATAAGFVVVVGLGLATYAALRPASDRFALCDAAPVAGGDLGGPFELVTHTGETVTDADVIDAPTLLYFGYSYCPDVCPLDVVRNADAADLLAEKGHAVQPVFVSIDPGRDTPEVLADFVTLVHDDMLGLTGSQAQVDKAVAAYRVYAKKNGEGEDYLMDHSTYTYLVAPDEGLLTFFRRDASPEAMAETTACFADALS